MSDDLLTRHAGPRHEGTARTSPYATSRLAPPHSLVDLAAEIARADEVIAATTQGKLEELAAQIRQLQARAREVVDEARVDAHLHRARCNFTKRVGAAYHLYRRPKGSLYFSMLSPSDWADPPHEFVGTFRLGADRSWTSTTSLESKMELLASLPPPAPASSS